MGSTLHQLSRPSCKPTERGALTASSSGVPPGTLKLAGLNSLCFLSFAIITPVLDKLIRGPFDLGNEGTARFMAVHGVATLIFGLLAGVLSDKLGRRVPLIVIGLIGSGITTTLIPHIGHFPSLLALRFIDGMFGAVALGLILTRALDLADEGNRNRTMGVMSIAIAGGFIMAPVLTGLLGQRSLTALFAIAGGSLILGGLWMAGDLGSAEQITRGQRGFRSSIRALTDRPRLLIPIAFAFIDKFTFGTLAHLTALAVKDLFGRETLASSLILLGFWIAFSLTCIPGGRICDRFGSLRTLVAGSALYGAALITLGWTGLTGFAVVMTLAGAFCAIQYVPSIALVGEFADPARRGLSMGVWNMSGSMGIVAGMIISGKLSTFSYALAFGVAGGLEILAALAGLLALAALNRPSPIRY